MKSGEISAQIWVIIGIIVMIVVLISVWSYPGKLFAPLLEDPEENIHSEQQFAIFSEQLRGLQDGGKFVKLYGVGKDYVVVGFLKGTKKLGGESCQLNGKQIAVEEVFKPKECEDKSCICLCRGGYAGCGQQGEYFCQQLGYDVRDEQNGCGYLVIGPRKVENVYVKREGGIAYVNLEQGGKAST